MVFSETTFQYLLTLTALFDRVNVSHHEMIQYVNTLIDYKFCLRSCGRLEQFLRVYHAVNKFTIAASYDAIIATIRYGMA